MKSIHQQILDTLNLKIGDTVKVTHKVKDYDLGWDNVWDDEGMNLAIENEYKVTGFGIKPDIGVQLSFKGTYYFPAQCLEVVERCPKYKEVVINDQYTAKIYPHEKIVVGF